MKAILLLAAIGSVCSAPPARAQELKPNTEFRIKLLAPVSTETNQKGDKITAQITSPAEFAGAMMEGEIKESKSGARLKPSPLRNSATLLMSGSTVPSNGRMTFLTTTSPQSLSTRFDAPR